MVTRFEVARYVAEQLPEQRRKVLEAVAAWLVATGRTRQADYLVQDVARVLAQNGYLAARVTTARPLSPAVHREIEAYLKAATGAATVELDSKLDSTAIGGLSLTTPTTQLNATLRHKLQRLAHRASQGERV